ncbi:unnamed protein product [Chondrus crispus]|uniref:Uncharacterized protein n=1 Tax=Chondrus crispus TaxID=2769 RepID=R7QJ54_CHOCR|nr:unnamed protein product [Chondrus crispus]CDF38124.1 unnamed protein product [Chondrus crispus]|eukprot:XP_005717993.1 unnamed protein product [Chondrus crispus]
MPSETLTKGN